MTFVSLFLLVFALLWALFFAAGPTLEKLLGKVAHRTAKFRYRDYLPVVVVLGVGLAATLSAGDAFMDIAETVQQGSAELTAIDSEVHTWARTAHTEGSTRFFVALTLVGTPVGLGILVALIAAALLLRKHKWWAMFLIFTGGVGGLLNLALKAFFARARPELAEALRHASGYSFPSGHAMGATVVFGALTYLALRGFTRWRFRAAAASLACTLILAIASSRIYLGVHWISDIAAGICAGLIWVAATTVAYETFRRIRRIRSMRASHAAQGE